MPSEVSALRLAEAWVAAWNRQDIDAILAHYRDDVEFTSPFAPNFTPDGSPTIHGRDALRAYFVRALGAYPDLHFELEHVLAGVSSIALVYRSVNDLRAVEVMELDDEERAVRVLVHYTRL